MVGKSYLRYVAGPQGGSFASSASLTLAATVVAPEYAMRRGAGRAQRHSGAAAALFIPSLEAVRVFSVRSGALLHTLVPADAKLPLEVTALHVVPIAAAASNGGDAILVDPHRSIEDDGWLLLVGYSNGCVALFTCSAANNYGKPRCKLYAHGHRVDTNVLALAVDASRTRACSAGQDTDITVWDLVAEEAAFALRGHRGGVVSLVLPPKKKDLLLSAAADGLIRVWDLALRQCVQTVIVTDGQVTAMAMDCEGHRLFCGTRECVMRVYALSRNDDDVTAGADLVIDHGSVARRYHKPITAFNFSPDWAFLLACTSKTVEVYRVLGAEEVKKKVQRKKKRRRQAAEAGAATEAKAEAETRPPLYAGATAAEEVVLLRTFFLTPHKVRGACFVPSPVATRAVLQDTDTLHLAVMFNHNTVRTYTTALQLSGAEGGPTWTLDDLKPRHAFDQHVHSSDIRALAFVDNDAVLLSMSQEKLLMWTLSVRPEHLECDHTDPHDFHDAVEANLARPTFKGLLNCCGGVTWSEQLEEVGAEGVSMAAISSRLCCVGLGSGTVCLVDATASRVVFAEPAHHAGGVRHVTKRPDQSGFLTVGADRRLVLWTVGLEAAAAGAHETPTQVTLLLSTEVELSESPLFAELSPDGRYLGVGLGNHNVQLLFADTLRPYLALFGHKLPPTSLSFSSDGALVASAGLDKSLRFWGTDFGDCHCAIHAHDDYITCVEFLMDTHYVLTVSLDGSMKRWDGDNWTMIQVFRDHPHGVWCVAATRNATCVATAGVDMCIRCYLRTQDILFPSEEEERLAQEAMDDEAMQRTAMQKLATRQHDGMEAVLAGQQTAATAEAAEKLMEALDLVSVELQRQQNSADTTTQRHPLLSGCTVWEYLWSVLEAVRPSELRHALASFTNVHADALLDYLLQMGRAGAIRNYEIAAKTVLALVMPAPGQSTGSLSVRAAAIRGERSEAHGIHRLAQLRHDIFQGLDRAAGRMDYNTAGLRVVQQRLEETRKVKFFDTSNIQRYKKKYHSRALDTPQQR